MQQKFITLNIISLLFSAILFSTLACNRSQPRNTFLIYDSFDSGTMDSALWKTTRDGDFREMDIDVRNISSSSSPDNRLRLRCDTIGTSDPLKFLGVMSKKAMDFTGRTTFKFEIDWNDQSNGSYLAGSFLLCPARSDNPKKEPSWFAFEYTGVPPGRNLRTSIWRQKNRSLKTLYEDWGARDEKGRPIGRAIGGSKHKISIVLDGQSVEVFEDGKVLLPLFLHDLDFTTAYVYFQMSSGTNYPSREIYFDNISVQSGRQP